MNVMLISQLVLYKIVKWYSMPTWASGLVEHGTPFFSTYSEPWAGNSCVCPFSPESVWFYCPVVADQASDGDQAFCDRLSPCGSALSSPWLFSTLCELRAFTGRVSSAFVALVAFLESGDFLLF